MKLLVKELELLVIILNIFSIILSSSRMKSNSMDQIHSSYNAKTIGS